MRKDELINDIARIDEQLKENRETLEPYFGKEIEACSNVFDLIRVTMMLLEARAKLRNELVNDYGVFIL